MANYLIITEAAVPGGAPAGAAINRVVADPGFDPGAGLQLVPDDGRAIWSTPAQPVSTVPVSVPNSDMRIVLQGHFLPDGRSLFTAIQTMLAGGRDQTASLPDSDPAKMKALKDWTRWDMGNFFLRAEPMIAEIGGAFGFTEAEVDALFVEAAAL